MSTKQFIVFWLTALSIVPSISRAQSAASPVSGESLYTEKLCITCHGVEGRVPVADVYPKLAFQNSAYLFEQSRYIRDGKRNTPMAASMRALIQGVSDEQLRAIADYLSKRSPQP